MADAPPLTQPLVGVPPGIDFANISAEQLAVLIFEDFQNWAEKFACFKGITGKIEDGLKPNVLQLRVIEHYRRCMMMHLPCLIMILKPRQKGASTIAEAICYFHMRRVKDLNGVLMGDVQSTSDKVFEMFRLYAKRDRYPHADGQPNIKPAGGDMADEITLSSGSKWWKETAGSSNAGRSGTVQVLHMDEVAHYPKSDSKDPTTAVLGSFHDELPTSLGFATSTANGASGWFYDTWFGDNEWKKIFAAWFEFPECSTPFSDDEHRAQFEASLKEDEKIERSLYNVSLEQLHWRRRTINKKYKGDINKFKQEHPSSPEGAFLASSRLRFDEVAVSHLLAWAKQNDGQNRQTGNLVRQGRRGVASWIPDPGGDVQRWEEPRNGCRYLVAVDTCTGKDQQIGGTTADPDWHAAQVWRQGYVTPNGTYLPPAMVALHHSRADIDILAEIVAAMSAYYGGCLVVPEVNNSGLALVKALEKEGVNIFRREAHTNVRRQQTEDERLSAFGWCTDKLTKKWIIDNLVPVVRQEALMIYSAEAMEEFKTFVIKDSGEPAAAPNKHDDHVLAAAIAIYNLGAATEYKLNRIGPMDLGRLNRDPSYQAPDGFRRKAIG